MPSTTLSVFLFEAGNLKYFEFMCMEEKNPKIRTIVCWWYVESSVNLVLDCESEELGGRGTNCPYPTVLSAAFTMWKCPVD